MLCKSVVSEGKELISNWPIRFQETHGSSFLIGQFNINSFPSLTTDLGGMIHHTVGVINIATAFPAKSHFCPYNFCIVSCGNPPELQWICCNIYHCYCSMQMIESGSKHQITIGSSEDIKRVRRVAVGSINYMY